VVGHRSAAAARAKHRTDASRWASLLALHLQLLIVYPKVSNQTFSSLEQPFGLVAMVYARLCPCLLLARYLCLLVPASLVIPFRDRSAYGVTALDLGTTPTISRQTQIIVVVLAQ
jgi:hypothetical protein